MIIWTQDETKKNDQGGNQNNNKKKYANVPSSLHNTTAQAGKRLKLPQNSIVSRYQNTAGDDDTLTPTV